MVCTSVVRGKAAAALEYWGEGKVMRLCPSSTGTCDANPGCIDETGDRKGNGLEKREKALRVSS